MNRYAIWQPAFECPSWQAVADALGAALGWHRTTARARVRRTGGILLENLEATTAERCCAVCADCGVAARTLPQESVVVLPRPMRVHELALRDDALVVRVTDREPESIIDWQRIVLLAASETTHAETYHHYRTVMHPMSRTMQVDLKVDTIKEAQTEPLADVFYRLPDNQLGRIRLQSRELNYPRILGADAPDPHVIVRARLLGFRLVLARIGSRASGATIPPETQALLGGTPAASETPHRFATLDEFDTCNRWLLQTKLHSGEISPPGD